MQKKHITSIISSLMLVMLLLTACNGNGADATPTVDAESVIATSIAETMEAMAATMTAQVTPTPESTPTQIVLPSPTVNAAAQPTTVMPTVALPANCLIADLVSETIPDGTVIARGATFTKEWRIINGGSCTWNTNYKLVFDSGDLLDAEKEEIPLSEVVNPNMSTTVSVKMKAPNVDGYYTGYWMLKTDQGVNVALYSVNIYVGTATQAPFAVTSVVFNTSSQTAQCPGEKFTVSISITTDGAGTVVLTVDNTNDAAGPSPEYSYEFTAAGTKTFNYDVDFSGQSCAPGLCDLNLAVYIKTPNNQTFYSQDYDITCQ